MARKIDLGSKKKLIRGNGEGTISLRTDGRYMAKITIGRDLNGKLIRKCIYGRTEEEVIEKKTEVMAEVFKGVYSEPSRMTLTQWLDIWFNTYKKMYIKDQTIELYQVVIEKIINPRMGDLKLKDIKQMHVQGLINTLVKDGYSSSTAYKVKNIINPAFNIAVTNKLIVENPFKNIQMPASKEIIVKALSRDEQLRFEANVSSSYFYEFFIVALDTGIRSGELLALTWDDVNFKKNEIKVTKTLITKKDKKQKKKILAVQDTPKTKTSNRKIPMTKRVRTLLENLQKKRIEMNSNDGNIVFCSQVGTYAYPKNVRRSLGIVFKKAEIDKSGTHVLRHTFATRLFEEKVSIKTISKLLGHASIEVTLNIYIHTYLRNTKKN